jgi:signal transduction histidine kinase
MRKSADSHPVSLFQWIRGSFLRTALVPLALIELFFLLIYFLANQWSTAASIDYLRLDSRTQLVKLAVMQSEKIENRLEGVAEATRFFGRQTAGALARTSLLSTEDAVRLEYAAEGGYYTASDKPGGGAAIFYTGFFPVGAAERQKVADVLPLESVMKDLIGVHPLVSAIYLNTFDSLNIIYPYFDVISQYQLGLDLRTFNFYYLADETNDPDRGVRWTDVYLDPAGQGWMASCISPVYGGDDSLQGVVGLDITVETFTSDILDLDIPWDGYALLIGQDGTILALPPSGEQDWGLTEITDHHYSEAILQDTYKPEAFNLFLRDDLASLSAGLKNQASGDSSFVLDGEMRAVSWSTIAATGWKILLIVPEATIVAPIGSIRGELLTIGMGMVAVLVAFFLFFLYVLSRRSRKMALSIAEPLLSIEEIVRRIGEGGYEQTLPALDVEEINETGRHVLQMGRQLGEMNRQSLEAQRSAEAANRLKSEFITNMSHEIRTPLNSILGYAQLLSANVVDPDTARYARTIQKSGNALLGIINDILDYSSLTAGQIGLQPVPVRLGLLFEDLTHIFAFQSREKNLPLVVDLDPAIPKLLYLDEVRVRQVLLNLLGNAFKFTESGQVELSARLLRIHSETGRTDVLIRVRDTGIGIPPDQQELIFEPFRQQDGQSTRRYGGTGLGLAIVRKYLELMGGKISVDSQVGSGSTFSILLSDLASASGEPPKTDLPETGGTSIAP